MKWRPIKTAPKDEIILLAQPPFNYGEHEWLVLQGRWIDIPHRNEVFKYLTEHTPIPTAPYDPHWVAVYDAVMVGGGCGIGETRFYESYPKIMHPTHWMPLPKPPRGRYKYPSIS